MTTMIPF